MAILIKANNANEMYEKSLKMIKTNGVNRIIPNKEDSIEIMHVLFELDNPIQKWVYSRMPAMNISFALAELFWIISGDNRREVLDTWNKNYSVYAADKDSDIYHGAYGYRLRIQNGIDQIDRAYLSLKNNPTNRQTIMIIWDAKEDMPQKDGTPKSKDIPCNICSMLKIVDNKLEWTQVMRSNDLLLGLPYNLIQFTSLQEIMAGWLGVEVGTYNHYSDSLHLYKNKNADIIKNSPVYKNCDSLGVPYNVFKKIAKDIKGRMDRLSVENNLTKDQLIEISTLNSGNTSYDNIMCIIAAYPILRKYKNESLAEDIVNMCKNNLYKYIWQKWRKTNK